MGWVRPGFNSRHPDNIMIAKKNKKVFTEFGEERIDNYFWMRDKKDPDVLKYIKYENNQTKKYLKDYEKFQNKLLKELKSRKREKDQSTPYFYNGYWYYKKYEKGKEYPIYFRKKDGLKARPEKYFDQNILARGKKYHQIGGGAISPDNKLFAYVEDTQANRRFTLKVKNLETGEMLIDEIKDISPSFVWGNDSKSVFYVEYDKSQRPFRVKRHILGQRADKVIFEEKNQIYYISVGKTRSKDFILIDVGSHDHEYQYYFSASGELDKPKLFKRAKKGVIYDIDHADGCWYIRTNEKVMDFEILKSKDGKRWSKFIESKNQIKSFEIFENYFVYEEVKDGIISIKTLNLKDFNEKILKFPGKVYLSEIGFNPEYRIDKLRIFFESPKDPETEIEYDFKTGKKKVLKVYKPRGKFDSNNYVVERKWVTSVDKKSVPLTLLYKKGVNKNSPCLLYGYGSYGYSIYPSFNENRFSLVDRGVIFAVAHIRGGQELGRGWYLDGKLLKKKNTFTDFIDCAKYLIKNKYTNADKLFAEGGSAGGLLMGAVANMAPELFKGMIFQVPFVDSLNTMMDPTIPLTVGEYVEWGDPNDKKYYKYMKSYAPYENIERKDYPAIFINSGYNDTQVHYWEPLKYIAKMKEYKTDKNPILLHMDVDTGHGGKPGRFAYLESVARVYSFIFKLLGIKK